mgnify:CR=1 FL=1
MRAFISLIAITTTLSVSADEDRDAVVDFSDGFARLAALGLPDMEGAQWTSHVPPTIAQSSPLSDWTYREVGIQPAGRAWRFPGDEPSYLHYGKTTITTSEETTDTKAESALEIDVKHLIRTLEKIASGKSDNSSSSYFATIRGAILVFATQVHGAGHPEEANRIANALFQTSTDRVAIIDQAVSEFANAKYAEITERFFAEHDWQSYHRDLSAIVEAYPRGWDKRLAVAMLIDRVAKRASNAPTSIPELPEINFDPDALAAVNQWMKPAGEKPEVSEDELANMAQQHGINLADVPAEHRDTIIQQLMQLREGGYNAHHTNIWLLNPPDPKSAHDPIAKTKSLGMAAVPVLAALVEDDTLTPIQNNSNQRTHYSSYRSSEAELARQYYQSMPRPMSRGEIATQLLQSILPGTEQHSQPSPLAMRDRAVEFWQLHHQKSSTELALVYFTEGNDQQKQLAAQHLASSDDPEAWKAFEKVILEAPDILTVAAFVQPYLEKRKHEARDFFETFAQKVRKSMEGIDIENVDYDDSAYRIASAGGADKFLSPLAVLAGASSIDDLLKDAVKAGADDPYAWDNLESSLKSTPLTELLKPIGQILADNDADIRSRMLSVFLQRAAYWTVDDRNSPPPEDSLPDDVTELWLPVIDDTSALTQDEMGWFEHYGCYTVQSAAGLALEFVCNQNAAEQIQRAEPILNRDKQLAALLVDRSKARLKRSPVPDYPSHTALSDQRKKEIESLITQSQPAELREKILALTPDEIDYWVEWRSGPWTETNPMPEVLQKLRQTVVHIAAPDDEKEKIQSGSFLKRLAKAVQNHSEDESGPNPALLEEIGVSPEFHLDGPAIESLAESLLKKATTRPITLVQFYADPLQLGLEASAQTGGEEARQWISYFVRNERVAEAAADADAIAMASVAGWENLIVWSIKDGTITAETKRAKEQFPAINVYRTYLESPNPNIPQTTIITITREAFQELLNNN